MLFTWANYGLPLHSPLTKTPCSLERHSRSVEKIFRFDRTLNFPVYLKRTKGHA